MCNMDWEKVVDFMLAKIRDLIILPVFCENISYTEIKERLTGSPLSRPCKYTKLLKGDFL